MNRFGLYVNLPLLIVFTSVAGCAGAPESVMSMHRSDDWGDRGTNIFERDYLMCSDQIENRRFMLQSCLSVRGWRLE